jgi:chromosome segregation protein
MFLEKLEIQGLKSFANKNELVFPGMLDGTKRGITAIVGPNGSGKSNVADAVRWALGEQSMKTLRGKKSEDVIFSGSDKKGKLSMAEVSMHLNNEDGKAPIDYSQLVITRRLYRNGESEYLINNNRVRLSDIQMLLAKAKFGQKTYSVIGQGMVEGFLNTTLAERKEFFDEATGVKQYQIKRDDALNKLRSSHENLAQAEMLLTEIEPRLNSLTRQVNKLKKRGEIESELRGLQLGYYGALWHDINGKFRDVNDKYLELENAKFDKDKKIAALNEELGKLEAESQKENEFHKLQREASEVQAAKDELGRKLAKLDAQLENRLEADGHFDLSFLLNKKEEISRQLKEIAEELASLGSSQAREREKAAELDSEKKEIEGKIQLVNQELEDLGNQKEDASAAELYSRLEKSVARLEKIDVEAEPQAAKALLQEIYEELKALVAEYAALAGQDTGADQGNWHAIHEKLTGLTKQKDDLSSRLNDNHLRVSSYRERGKLLKEREQGLKNELADIEIKLKKQSESFDYGDLEKEREEVKAKLGEKEEELKQINGMLAGITAKEEEKRSHLFGVQKKLQELQGEANDVNTRLQALKIDSTRYETKLEDLEAEIRDELGGLKEVKENKPADDVKPAELKGKIGQLKRQLELIGGIDPAVEQEYIDTKERYDFLTGQVTDFSQAVESLEKIIKELDQTIRQQFDKEFKLIEQNFEKYFKILFNGGSAKIIKVMEDEKGKSGNEEGEVQEEEAGKNAKGLDLKRIKFLQKHNATGLAGIEIQATPPGKKIKSISMLSGGERALTAIALICAIISANPSPFVVLDEVDAALDEANSERLAKILDELSHKTQFIVITHNRASMRRANVLYGVTMGDDGVSKLLSIKLDEAKKMEEEKTDDRKQMTE